jgi:hypothetical protein
VVQARLEALKASKKEPAAPAVALKSSPVKPAAAAPATPSAPSPASAAAPAQAAASYGPAVPGSHTLDALKAGLPEGVDPAAKEDYLDDATFAEVFKTDRAAFRGQPKWKRDAAKKAAGLF